MARARTAVRCLVLGVAALGLTTPGCVEERVVSRKGLLTSLPGAQTGGIPDGRNITRADILRTPIDGIRQKHEDGSVILYAKSVQHLMSHIVQTVQNDEAELFTQQVLSSKTRQEFVVRGYDPTEAYKEIVRRRRDVFRLFNTMPFGERTPGLFLQPLAERNQFRLRLPKSSWGDLRWTGIDVVFEDGNYRLLWFTER